MARKQATRRSKRNLDPITAAQVAQMTGADKVLFGRKGFAALADKKTYFGSRRNPKVKEFYIVPRGHNNFAIYVNNGRGFQYAESGGTREYLAGYYLKRGYVEVLAPHSNPDDIELLNDLAPQSSLGHIEFTSDGIERYMRDGYVYQAFTSTPVFPDGYRMGSVETTANQFAMANPAKYERCVKAVQARGGANGYAVCTAQGLRNPQMSSDEFRILAVTDDTNFVSVAKSYGMSVAGPSDSGVFLVRDASGKAWLFTTPRGKWKERDALPSVWSDLNVERMGGERNPRRKRNPADEADSVYQDFHGVPPSETLEFRESLHVHGHLGGLGDLVHIVVKLTAGSKSGTEVQLNAPDPSTAEDSDIVRLASNEDRSQLYLVGGDQSLDVKKLGFRESFDITHDGETFEATEIKDNMIIGLIQRIMYQTEKKFDNFETIDYHHEAGEDTQQMPVLTYDTMNQKMGISGGAYAIDAVGVVN